MPSTSELAIQDWLEWEEAVLRPAISAPHAGLQAALQRLGKAVSATDFVAGSAPTVADAAIFATLHGLANKVTTHPSTYT